MTLPPLRTQVGADTTGFVSGIGSAAASLGSFKGGLLAASGALGAAGLVGGLTSATRAFSRFDEKMTESQAIMGDLTDGTMARMERQALDVSRTTLKSAEEAAESYFFLASAGLDAEQSISALPQVARFAQAGMFDMARATELATDAQSALGLTSEDARQNLEGLTRTTDVLVSANQQANATVEQFSDALTNKLGARLRILNKDIEEGVAGLAALADQGIKGRRAGRGLSIVFRDLAREAVRSEGAFEDLGIRVFDNQGRMRNLADIVQDFEERLGGMNDKQRTAELQLLGINRRAIGFLNTLIGMSDEIAEYESNLDSAGGATEEVADKQVQTLNKQVDLLGDEMAAATITIGGMASEVLNLEENVGLLRRGIRNIREELQGFEDRLEAAFGTEAAKELQADIDRIAFQFDEIDSGDLQDQIAGAGQALREEFGEPAARRFESAAQAAIQGVQRGRIEAEKLNEVLSERFRIIARQRARDRQRREDEAGEGEEEDGITAEERERRRQREAAAKAEQTLEQVRLRMLEKELGLVDRIVARRRRELRALAASGAEQSKLVSKAREIVELRREGLDVAARFQQGVRMPAAAGGGRGGGLPADERVEGPEGGMPDVSELDVSDPVGRAADALSDSLVPALDEVAGHAIEGQSALGSLADALLTAFSKQFGGKGGVLGLGAKLAGGFAGGFQSGGTVPAGSFAVVGEDGPEPIFAPRGGRVLSNREARKAMGEGGGGGRTVNVNVSTEIRALDAADVDRVLRRGGQRAIVDAVLEATRGSSDVSRAIVAGTA